MVKLVPQKYLAQCVFLRYQKNLDFEIKIVIKMPINGYKENKCYSDLQFALKQYVGLEIHENHLNSHSQFQMYHSTNLTKT